MGLYGAAVAVAPGDEFVAVFIVFERDVVGRARPNRIERLLFVHGKTRTDIQQTPSAIRRGDGYARHARKPPQQLSVEVVGARFAGAGRDDFGAFFILPHIRRGPVAFFIATASARLPCRFAYRAPGDKNALRCR